MTYRVKYTNQHGSDEVAIIDGSNAVEVFTNAMEESGGTVKCVEYDD